MEMSFRFRGTPDGRFEHMDQTFFEFTGLSEDLVYGKPGGWMEAVHPDDVERARALWGMAALQLDQYDLEVRVRTVRGTYATLCGSAVPVRQNGEVVAWEGHAVIGGVDCASGKRAASDGQKRWTAPG
jgi:PAS domain-containing protein